MRSYISPCLGTDCVDEDGSGFLEIGELKAVVEYLGIDGEAKSEAQLLKILDTDGDGRVSKSEFAAYCEKHSKLAGSLVQQQKEKQAKAKLAKIRWKKAGTKVKSVVRLKKASTLKSVGYTALRALSNPADVVTETLIDGAYRLGNPVDVAFLNKEVEILSAQKINREDTISMPLGPDGLPMSAEDLKVVNQGQRCGNVIYAALTLTFLWYALQMVILGSKEKNVKDVGHGANTQDMSQCRHLGTLGLGWGLWIILVSLIQIATKCFCPPKANAEEEPETKSTCDQMLEALGSASLLLVGYGIRFTFNQPGFHKNQFGKHMCDNDLFNIVYGFTMFNVVLMMSFIPCACCLGCCLLKMNRREEGLAAGFKGMEA